MGSQLEMVYISKPKNQLISNSAQFKYSDCIILFRFQRKPYSF